jgi:hypothetical protein
MMEDDYEVELWNPLLTFYHKSPDVRYTSQGNWVGKTDMYTVSDVIDKYGHLLTTEQHEALESVYPIRSAGYTIGGYQNDGTFYDGTKSHDWNVNMPSLAYRQYTTAMSNSVYSGGDIIAQILSEGEDYYDQGTAYLLRCTTAYWKSQRKVGHLTKINEIGEVETETALDPKRAPELLAFKYTELKEAFTVVPPPMFKPTIGLAAFAAVARKSPIRLLYAFIVVPEVIDKPFTVVKALFPERS